MTLSHNLHLYSFLSRFSLVNKSYVAKIILIAFLGTHIPLLSLLLNFVISHVYTWEVMVQVLSIALVATLAGTGATLYALHRLLAPVILTSATLQNYLSTQTLPKLPIEFSDEVGTLMANTSKTLHQLDELIHYISYYDDLTGLPNRNLFCDRFAQTQAQNNPQLIAVLVVGIDDFMEMSHAWKPETSRMLLRAIAQRLISCITHPNILAHLNDDEFAIALLEISSFESVIHLSQLLRSTLMKPFPIEGHLIHLTASVGISINSVTAYDTEQFLQQAHMALHTAQQQGRGQYQFYSPEISAQLQERLALENELYGAIERGEMCVYYQPLIDLQTQQVIALEALVRWQHPTRGLVSPAKFIPIAESNDLIQSLGEWVLRTACAQTRAWQLAGLHPVRISVNLSARQFEQPNLVDIVKQILEETELAAPYLELEVTESALMVDIEQSIEILGQLRDLGIVLALDDFGTGYSSLNYLTRFPVNMLKIDRSFVQDIMSNPNSAAVTDAIIALSQSLCLTVTAEGIETQEQLDYLQSRGCHEAQGFYFSRPAPAAMITEMLKNKSQKILTV
ncbi:diguanylate cyclase/phosphodiesterase [Leptolyngbya boryana NIES-2135]|uniref:Diguanylate cyclase/phosphodiesterase n=2 Tax=Leptolyngbya boryana TaxID=1184 RepID=A0A1Z4JIQ9_LEPBY|nr:EAL domain-containing protein [Leptolyngbya sp. FACHB-161]MBD2377350.1 EAL domain-containing protein [Leptolyngbya sp. FACHB-238]MBD2401759.1 EAL domain-containing protein [Leptolyngbya sp. FACHB-239]MBD2408226.1 EAL domain-containing protein [Leptolyngbya sp. FACHB-402]BAY56620.1 diguanylate cyclase/phosphodiesterase [Leptolyngbya boryana NIES-2135]